MLRFIRTLVLFTISPTANLTSRIAHCYWHCMPPRCIHKSTISVSTVILKSQDHWGHAYWVWAWFRDTSYGTNIPTLSNCLKMWHLMRVTFHHNRGLRHPFLPTFSNPNTFYFSAATAPNMIARPPTFASFLPLLFPQAAWKMTIRHTRPSRETIYTSHSRTCQFLLGAVHNAFQYR